MAVPREARLSIGFFSRTLRARLNCGNLFRTFRSSGGCPVAKHDLNHLEGSDQYARRRHLGKNDVARGLPPQGRSERTHALGHVTIAIGRSQHLAAGLLDRGIDSQIAVLGHDQGPRRKLPPREGPGRQDRKDFISDQDDSLFIAQDAAVTIAVMGDPKTGTRGFHKGKPAVRGVRCRLRR